MLQAKWPLAVTDAELERIGEENPGWTVERIDGGVVMSPTNSEAGRRNARLTRILVDWADRHDYVCFDSSAGFSIGRDVLSPDAALVSSSRWNALSKSERSSYAPLVPDIVVELVSSNGEAPYLRKKCQRWHDAGARYVILFDPLQKSVETWGEAPSAFPESWEPVLS